MEGNEDYQKTIKINKAISAIENDIKILNGTTYMFAGDIINIRLVTNENKRNRRIKGYVYNMRCTIAFLENALKKMEELTE